MGEYRRQTVGHVVAHERLQVGPVGGEALDEQVGVERVAHEAQASPDGLLVAFFVLDGNSDQAQ